jgi:hypothetical protein
MATDVWRLNEAPTSWVVLGVGGSALAVGAAPQATCRACDSAPLAPPLRGGRERNVHA